MIKNVINLVALENLTTLVTDSAGSSTASRTLPMIRPASELFETELATVYFSLSHEKISMAKKAFLDAIELAKQIEDEQLRTHAVSRVMTFQDTFLQSCFSEGSFVEYVKILDAINSVYAIAPVEDRILKMQELLKKDQSALHPDKSKEFLKFCSSAYSLGYANCFADLAEMIIGSTANLGYLDMLFSTAQNTPEFSANPQRFLGLCELIGNHRLELWKKYESPNSQRNPLTYKINEIMIRAPMRAAEKGNVGALDLMLKAYLQLPKSEFNILIEYYALSGVARENEIKNAITTKSQPNVPISNHTNAKSNLNASNTNANQDLDGLVIQLELYSLLSQSGIKTPVGKPISFDDAVNAALRIYSFYSGTYSYAGNKLLEDVVNKFSSFPHNPDSFIPEPHSALLNVTSKAYKIVRTQIIKDVQAKSVRTALNESNERDYFSRISITAPPTIISELIVDLNALGYFRYAAILGMSLKKQQNQSSGSGSGEIIIIEDQLNLIKDKAFAGRAYIDEKGAVQSADYSIKPQHIMELAPCARNPSEVFSAAVRIVQTIADSNNQGNLNLGSLDSSVQKMLNAYPMYPIDLSSSKALISTAFIASFAKVLSDYSSASNKKERATQDEINLTESKDCFNLRNMLGAVPALASALKDNSIYHTLYSNVPKAVSVSHEEQSIGFQSGTQERAVKLMKTAPYMAMRYIEQNLHLIPQLASQLVFSGISYSDAENNTDARLKNIANAFTLIDLTSDFIANQTDKAERDSLLERKMENCRMQKYNAALHAPLYNIDAGFDNLPSADDVKEKTKYLTSIEQAMVCASLALWTMHNMVVYAEKNNTFGSEASRATRFVSDMTAQVKSSELLQDKVRIEFYKDMCTEVAELSKVMARKNIVVGMSESFRLVDLASPSTYFSK